jgi:hypothetical protein
MAFRWTSIPSRQGNTYMYHLFWYQTETYRKSKLHFNFFFKLETIATLSCFCFSKCLFDMVIGIRAKPPFLGDKNEIVYFPVTLKRIYQGTVSRRKKLFFFCVRVAACYIFKPKIQIWVNFGGSCNQRCCYILWPFGLFTTMYVVYFMVN